MLSQDKLFKGHQMSIFNQMLYVNICSAIVSFNGMSSPAVYLNRTCVPSCSLATQAVTGHPL